MQKVSEQIVDILLEERGDDEWEFSRGQAWGKRDAQDGTERDLEHYPSAFAKGYRAAQGGGVKSWLSGAWQGVKNFAGVGQDSLGMGKNTEKGWKPNYGSNLRSDTSFIPKRRPQPRYHASEEPGPKTWDIG